MKSGAYKMTGAEHLILYLTLHFPPNSKNVYLCQKNLLALVTRICFWRQWEKDCSLMFNTSFCAWLPFAESENLNSQNTPGGHPVPWTQTGLKWCPSLKWYLTWKLALKIGHSRMLWWNGGGEPHSQELLSKYFIFNPRALQTQPEIH